MPESFIPFALPDLTEEDALAVADVVRSGWLTTGTKAAEFERKLSEFFEGAHVILTSSATAGFDILFAGAPVWAEAIFPVWTFSSPVMAAYRNGIKPVIVDIDPDTFNMTAEAAKTAITRCTRFIVPTHFAGFAADIQGLIAVTQNTPISIIEDAAHALPALHQGQKIGTLDTSASVFSFYATKTLTTGEGGCVVTKDEVLAGKLRKTVLHGFDRSAYDRYKAGGSWRFNVERLGAKANMTDMAAVLGISQLARVHTMQVGRADIARQYNKAFFDSAITIPVASDPRSHARHLYPIRLPVGADRDRFIELMTEAGIGTSVHFIPLYEHSFWAKQLGLKASQFPNAEREFKRVVSLPIYSSMKPGQCERVIGAVLDAVEKC